MRSPPRLRPSGWIAVSVMGRSIALAVLLREVGDPVAYRDLPSAVEAALT